MLSLTSPMPQRRLFPALSGSSLAPAVALWCCAVCGCVALTLCGAFPGSVGENLKITGRMLFVGLKNNFTNVTHPFPPSEVDNLVAMVI